MKLYRKGFPNPIGSTVSRVSMACRIRARIVFESAGMSSSTTDKMKPSSLKSVKPFSYSLYNNELPAFPHVAEDGQRHPCPDEEQEVLPHSVFD